MSSYNQIMHSMDSSSLITHYTYWNRLIELNILIELITFLNFPTSQFSPMPVPLQLPSNPKSISPRSPPSFSLSRTVYPPAGSFGCDICGLSSYLRPPHQRSSCRGNRQPTLRMMLTGSSCSGNTGYASQEPEERYRSPACPWWPVAVLLNAVNSMLKASALPFLADKSFKMYLQSILFDGFLRLAVEDALL